MSLKKSYIIFGLGRYGIAVAKELVKSGAEVLAVDIDEENVNDAATELPFCKCADSSDPQVLKQLGVSNFDVAIISMAGNLEASVMTVALCKELGVKTVIAKCANRTHQIILSKVGADRVVFPENESGIRLARSLLSSDFLDAINLSEEISIVDVNVPDQWVGKTLIELNLRKKYALNIIAIKAGNGLSIDVDPAKPLEKDTNLVVIAHTKNIKKLSKDIG